MDLYIRSQDKTDLSKINRLKIREHVFENGEKEYFILNNNSMSDVVGIYKTKERALEVLDEIQNILKQEEMLHINKSLLNDLDDIEEPKYILKPVYQPRVYEMPQD